MKFLLHCVSFCVSSSSSVEEHPPTNEASLNQGRKRGRLTVSRSIPTSNWRPSLGAIYEDAFVEEAEWQKKLVIAAAESDRICRRNTKRSEFHHFGLNLRSYRFDNDFGRRSGLSSMNSGFCVTPFMI